MIVVIVGYMGSGKSAVGNEVAKMLKYQFVDLDDYISKKLNMSVLEIFETKGELYFRKVEKECLNEILSTQNNIVLSLGGGTPCYYNNYELYYNIEGVVSFYLKATFSTLLERLYLEKDKRPLINSFNKEALKEFIAKHLFERNEYYAKTNYSVDVATNSIEFISKEIISKLT